MQGKATSRSKEGDVLAHNALNAASSRMQCKLQMTSIVPTETQRYGTGPSHVHVFAVGKREYCARLRIPFIRGF